MMMDKVLKTTQACDNLDATLLHILNDVKSGALSIDKASSGLSHLIHLIDNRDPDAENYLKQARKLIQR